MRRQDRKTVDDAIQKPLESYPDGTANAPQRDPFEQQTLDQRPGLIRDEVVLRARHKLAWACLALMMLCAVLLEAG